MRGPVSGPLGGIGRRCGLKIRFPLEVPVRARQGLPTGPRNSWSQGLENTGLDTRRKRHRRILSLPDKALIPATVQDGQSADRTPALCPVDPL